MGRFGAALLVLVAVLARVAGERAAEQRRAAERAADRRRADELVASLRTELARRQHVTVHTPAAADGDALSVAHVAVIVAVLAGALPAAAVAFDPDSPGALQVVAGLYGAAYLLALFLLLRWRRRPRR